MSKSLFFAIFASNSREARVHGRAGYQQLVNIGHKKKNRIPTEQAYHNPLYHALVTRSGRCTKLLIKYGADPAKTHGGRNALHLAVDRRICAEHCVDASADVISTLLLKILFSLLVILSICYFLLLLLKNTCKWNLESRFSSYKRTN